MTREEAVDIINSCVQADTEEVNEALDMAIKALEQETCEDAISRQATVDFLEKHAETYEDVRVKMGFKASASLINNRNNLPPVTPIRPKGHWIKGKYKDDDIRYNDSSYKCDKCGKIVDFKENYCPNCGAKMVEPQIRYKGESEDKK